MLGIMTLSRVLHIGAAAGEVEFYNHHGVDCLTYVEPDRQCLISLAENIRKIKSDGATIEVNIIPKACSAKVINHLIFMQMAVDSRLYISLLLLLWNGLAAIILNIIPLRP